MTNPDSIDPAQVRVSDADRNAALDDLSEHFVNGTLDITLFEERTGLAAIAKTRGELDKLFIDLPELNRASEDPHPNAPAVPHSLETEVQEGQAELDSVLHRASIVQKFDIALWSITFLLFFLGLFVFHWPFFWVVFPTAALGRFAIRTLVGLSENEEEIFEELKETEAEKRTERLRQAAARRKELGR